MKRHQRLLAGLRLYVLEYFLVVIDEKITVLVLGSFYRFLTQMGFWNDLSRVGLSRNQPDSGASVAESAACAGPAFGGGPARRQPVPT